MGELGEYAVLVIMTVSIVHYLVSTYWRTSEAGQGVICPLELM